MKRGKTLPGWGELIEDIPSRTMGDGYSSIAEIAAAKNISISRADKILRVLEREGKIEFKRVRDHNGRSIKLYKD